MAFLYGASSHLLPQATLPLVMNGVIPNEYKRQASDDINKVFQCDSEKLDTVIQGSHFVLNCKSAGIQEFDFSIIDFNDSSLLQSVVTGVYQILCIPECGDVILDAYNDCGVFDVFPGEEKYFIGGCGKNQNGDFCYEIFSDAIDLFDTELSCDTSMGTCSCQSELSAGITNQGCCIDAYHSLFESVDISTYNPGSLYSACDVNLPKGCNNSPLTGSDTLPLISAFITPLCALMLTTLLG